MSITISPSPSQCCCCVDIKKNAFSIQHWEQLHSFPSLQLNLFPFWRNSHFHIYRIILFWFGAQSAQLQTSFEMGREKSSNLDFEQNFGSNSNLTSWLPDWKFWKRAKYQWFLRKRQMESIFPPIPLHSFLLHFSSALLRPVSLFKVIPGRRGESGKFVQFQNCFSLFPPEKWTPPDEFLKLFKRRLEIRLASKRGRDAYIPPPCSRRIAELEIFHKHKRFIRFVSGWCWGWQTKTEHDSESI